MPASAGAEPRRSADDQPAFLVRLMRRHDFGNDRLGQALGPTRVPCPGPCAAQFISELSASKSLTDSGALILLMARCLIGFSSMLEISV